MTTPNNRPTSQRPYWANDDATRTIPSSTPSSVQQVPSSKSVQGASPRAENKGPSLLAGRFDVKHTSLNLAVLAGLASVITFAIIVVIDRSLGALTEMVPQDMSNVVLTAIITGLVGIAVGLLYIPVVGTGNENLFGIAILALAVAAAAVWVIFGGLLDGDWSTITVLAVIICTAGAAYAAPSRIESARVR